MTDIKKTIAELRELSKIPMPQWSQMEMRKFVSLFDFPSDNITAVLDYIDELESQCAAFESKLTVYEDRCEMLEKQIPKWQPIETAPKDGTYILLFYKNSFGNSRVVKASWFNEDDVRDIDTDFVGLEAGWFESIDNWPDYSEVAIHEGTPTHWIPLPKTPEEE